MEYNSYWDQAEKDTPFLMHSFGSWCETWSRWNRHLSALIGLCTNNFEKLTDYFVILFYDQNLFNYQYNIVIQQEKKLRIQYAIFILFCFFAVVDR